MRWPLRLQIMLPMAAIMLLSVLVVGGSGAYLAATATKARIDAQVSGVAQILAESNFPLTDAVLQQMKALSGAEFALVDNSGNVVASSGASGQFNEHLKAESPNDRRSVLRGDHVWVRDEAFFHSTLELRKERRTGQIGTLHIFYPEREYRRAWQSSIFPTLGFVALALPAVMILAAVTASTISRRMNLLQRQVDRIAEGDFRQMVVSDRDDEIRALSHAVNRMASMLAEYEHQVRHTERMRTLAQLGGGVAHQLRNSATGCSMALDLHSEECSTGETCESLNVAKRQLRLMEEYIQRFLQLGKPAEDFRSDVIDLPILIDNLLPLVQPAARHGGVALEWDRDRSVHGEIVGDASAFSQLVINLLLNAVDAAADAWATSSRPGRVVVSLAEKPAGRLALTISDSGDGPAVGGRDQLFQPFVSKKPDGVGLGLWVASEVAARHGGRIDWQRSEDMTHFTVELPAAHAEVQCA
jgi:signal transduction histidine kinase